MASVNDGRRTRRVAGQRRPRHRIDIDAARNSRSQVAGALWRLGAISLMVYLLIAMLPVFARLTMPLGVDEAASSRRISWTLTLDSQIGAGVLGVLVALVIAIQVAVNIGPRAVSSSTYDALAARRLLLARAAQLTALVSLLIAWAVVFSGAPGEFSPFDRIGLFVAALVCAILAADGDLSTRQERGGTSTTPSRRPSFMRASTASPAPVTCGRRVRRAPPRGPVL